MLKAENLPEIEGMRDLAVLRTPEDFEAWKRKAGRGEDSERPEEFPCLAFVYEHARPWRSGFLAAEAVEALFRALSGRSFEEATRLSDYRTAKPIRSGGNPEFVPEGTRLELLAEGPTGFAVRIADGERAGCCFALARDEVEIVPVPLEEEAARGDRV